MSLSSAEKFLKDLLTNPIFLLKVAELPEAEIAPALKKAGYSFTPREINDLICQEFYNIKDRLHIGDGDVRDLIMQKGGRFMS